MNVDEGDDRVEDRGLSQVRTYVRQYAQKDVFRRLKEESQEGGRATAFTFDWLSIKEPLRLVYDPDRDTLELKKLFRDIPPAVEGYISPFLEERQAGEKLPEHKRIDTRKMTASYRKEDGDGSLVFAIQGPGDYEYCLRKLVNLTNELFFSLQMRHGDYMLMAFGGSDE